MLLPRVFQFCLKFVCCFFCYSCKNVFELHNRLFFRDDIAGCPANIRLDEDVLKKSFVFVFGRRLQDEYVRLSLTSSEDVFKTSSRRLGQDQYIRLGYTSSRRLQDVFKTSCQDVFKTFSRRLQDVWQKGLQDIFKTSSRRFEDVFKTSSRRLEKHLQDIFKTSSRRIIKLNCSCEHVFEKHSTGFRDALFQRRLSTEEYAQVTLLLTNLWSVYKICKRDKNFSSFSFTSYYNFSGYI